MTMLRRAEESLKAREFRQLALCVALGARSRSEAWRIAESAGCSKSVVAVLKAAVAAGALTDANMGVALAPYMDMAAAFSQTLVNRVFFDTMLQDFWPAPPHSRFAIVIADATVKQRAEGAAGAVTQMVLSSGMLDEIEVDGIAVTTEELLRYGVAAQAIIQASMERAAGTATDGVFIPALQGLATTLQALGLDAAGVHNDVRRMSIVHPAGAASRPHIAMGSVTARNVTAMPDASGRRAFPEMSWSGGFMCGIPVVVSDELSDSVLMADASGFAGSASAIELRASRQTSIQMSNTPSQKSGPTSPTESNSVSMWQSNSVALKVSRRISFEALRPAVVELENVQWGLVGSPPA